jgi:hypothetical protein
LIFNTGYCLAGSDLVLLVNSEGWRGSALRELNEEKLGAVIDRFYEAAAQPDLWQTVLHETSIALGSEGAILLPYPDLSSGMVWSQGTDELINAFARGQWENTRAARGFLHQQWDLHSEASLFQHE